MRIQIDQKNAEEIEMAKKSNENGPEKSIKVCDFTEKMANNEEETEDKN